MIRDAFVVVYPESMVALVTQCVGWQWVAILMGLGGRQVTRKGKVMKVKIMRRWRLPNHVSGLVLGSLRERAVWILWTIEDTKSGVL